MIRKLEVKYPLIVISLVIRFFEMSSWIDLVKYLPIFLITLYITKIYQDKEIETRSLSDDEREYLYSVIVSILRRINKFNHQNDMIIRSELQIKINHEEELISIDEGSILSNPLISKGEKNLIEIERDVAIIQVLLIFIPLIFVVIHFFVHFLSQLPY